MSITAQPSTPFTAELFDVAQGLVGMLTVGIYTSPQEVQVTAPTAAGIVEYTQADGTSNYQATLTAPATVGKYMVVWRAGTSEGTEDLAVSRFLGPADVVPTVDDVAAILHQRLNAGGGNTAVTFDANTSPTATQVQRLIDMWAPVVLIEFGDLSDTALICSNASDIRAAVQALIAAHVAKVIEVSYWPQDVTGRDTAEAYWATLIDKQLPRVVQAAAECRTGADVPGGGPGEGGRYLPPKWQFNVMPRVGTRRL